MSSNAMCQPKDPPACQPKDPPACVSWPLCPSPSPRKTYPNRFKTAVLRMLPLVGGATLRMVMGNGSPILRTRGTGIINSSCSPGGLPGVGCTWHGFTVCRPVWICRLGSQSKGKRHCWFSLAWAASPGPPQGPDLASKGAQVPEM